MNWLVFAVIFCVMDLKQISSSEILVIFPTTAQSHYRVVRPLIHGLLDRGHKIIAITNFPDENERTNLSHINIAGLKPHSKFATNENSLMKVLSRITGNVNTYATILDHPPVLNLLQSNRKFDLVIAEFFLSTPIFAPIATAVDAPIIGFCPMFTFPWIYEVMGVDQRQSIMPSILDKFTRNTPFVERISSLVKLTFLEFIFNWIYMPKVQDTIKNHYGIQIKSLVESISNISLIFTNNYHSMLVPLPNVPGIVEVGGIHVVDEKPLSQDLNDFINGADHGVILFSLGSVVSESSIGADKLNHIFNAFSKLKQRVIMKFDNENYKIQIANVKVVKWFPQRDLLAHPKVLLFVSHAGIMSVIETIHCGKPMVAIPIFGDQPINANILVEKKVAVTVDYSNFKSDQLFHAINEALTDKYRINAKKLQILYNDRPQSPLETAIYWTEYVIRNKNESKDLLKSSKIYLNFYQTYFIDLIAVFILPVTVMSVILWKMKCLPKC